MVRQRKAGEQTDLEAIVAPDGIETAKNRSRIIQGHVHENIDEPHPPDPINHLRTSMRDVPMGDGNADGLVARTVARTVARNPEFFANALKFGMCFLGLQLSYLTWGYMQELIMTTKFNPTASVPSGHFPSAAFCVFSNRFLAVIVAIIAVRIKHGAIFANNAAPLWAFTPCALSNTMSSWSQYASLKYVSFPVQTIFKSSKIIPVMMMGKFLKGTSYPFGQYVEAVIITIGRHFRLLTSLPLFALQLRTEILHEQALLYFQWPVRGLRGQNLEVFCLLTTHLSRQDKIYSQYGRASIDPYQMMLGVNISAICITTAGLIVTGDIPIVVEFLRANPIVFQYNIITAITSASGQLCIFYTIKEFGPIAFTIIMTTRQMFSICISAIVFGHPISARALYAESIMPELQRRGQAIDLNKLLSIYCSLNGYPRHQRLGTATQSKDNALDCAATQSEDNTLDRVSTRMMAHENSLSGGIFCYDTRGGPEKLKQTWISSSTVLPQQDSCSVDGAPSLVGNKGVGIGNPQTLRYRSGNPPIRGFWCFRPYPKMYGEETVFLLTRMATSKKWGKLTYL
eukprot:scaffold3450_cov114-Cylindrotheca_fusiformis.AAC.15